MKLTVKSTLSAIILSAAIGTSLQTYAVDEVNAGPGLTYVGAPLAIRGIDPVAFIELGNRIQGQATWASKHKSVAYYFSSEDNLKKFEKSPDRFIPQFGGFCAYGVSVGKKFDGDPSYAAVIDDKLYVFLNEGVFKAFLKDKKGVIKNADKQWKSIEHTAALSL